MKKIIKYITYLCVFAISANAQSECHYEFKEKSRMYPEGFLYIGDEKVLYGDLSCKKEIPVADTTFAVITIPITCPHSFASEKEDVLVYWSAFTACFGPNPQSLRGWTCMRLPSCGTKIEAVKSNGGIIVDVSYPVHTSYVYDKNARKWQEINTK